ncbi:hypothetical protein GCM10009547_09700 [Sporichthya brevicatena]|uniref:DUF202 domain-containing protein n=1 Tax=Sporichthya brevicatena TaxID=171442 RepID=A0ABN1GE77_9ACTN
MRLTPVSGPRGRLPGLPAQRTMLAWDRTALALIAHGAFVLVRNPTDGSPARIVSAALSLALALLVAGLGRLRAREIGDSDRTRYARVPTRPLMILTAGVLLLGVADLVAILH